MNHRVELDTPEPAETVIISHDAVAPESLVQAGEKSPIQ